MDKGKKVVLIPFKLCHKLLIWCMMSQFVVIKDQQHQHGRQLCTEKILKKMKITLNLFILTTAVMWMEGLSVLWAANIQDQLCEVQVMDFGNDQWDNVTNAYLKLRIFYGLMFHQFMAIYKFGKLKMYLLKMIGHHTCDSWLNSTHSVHYYTKCFPK